MDYWRVQYVPFLTVPVLIVGLPVNFLMVGAIAQPTQAQGISKLSGLLLILQWPLW